MIAAAAWLGAMATAPIVPLPPDPLDLALVWHAPQRCSSAADIEARVRALLPGEPAGEGTLHVEGTVVASRAGFTLELASTFRNHTDRRTIVAPSCEELATATTLLLVVALEPGLAPAWTSAPAGEPVVSVERTPAADPRDDAIAAGASVDEDARPTATIDTPSVASASSRTRVRAQPLESLRLRIAGGLEIGAVPMPAGAMQLAGVVAFKPQQIEYKKL